MTKHAHRLNVSGDSTPRAWQGGVMLIEALVAMLVFSIGILALIGLQAVAMKEVALAKMRSDASYVADRIIGDLSTIDQTTLNTYAGDYTATARPGGVVGVVGVARADLWSNNIAQYLPEGRVTIQVPAVGAGPNPPPPTLTLIVSWTNAQGGVTGPPSPCWNAADTQPRSCFVQSAIVSDQ